LSCLIIMLTANCSLWPGKAKESRLEPAPPKIEPEEVTAPEPKPSGKISLFDALENLKPEKYKKTQAADKAKPRQTSPVKRRADKNRYFYLPTRVNPRDKSVMVLVNKGNYLVGKPGTPGLHKISIPAFYIDQYETTAEKYKVHNPAYSEKPFNGGKACPTCPAMGIDWKSARQYCRWAGKRLPSEAEWEAAARGPTNHHWPWGDNWLPKYANTLNKEDSFANAAPVGSFPTGASPSGALDMAGNVWEWVSAEVPVAKKNSFLKNPLYALKGGSWKSSPDLARISFRHLANPSFKNSTFGFRCAKSIKPKAR